MPLSTFTQEVFDKVCENLLDGTSLTKICKREEMPNKSTFLGWVHDKPELADQYIRACDIGMESRLDEINDIANDSSNDYGFKEGEDKDGQGAKPVFLAENVQRSRLRIDTLKWQAGKQKPKKYGDRVTQEHTGANGGPIVITSTPTDERL